MNEASTHDPSPREQEIIGNYLAEGSDLQNATADREAEHNLSEIQKRYFEKTKELVSQVEPNINEDGVQAFIEGMKELSSFISTATEMSGDEIQNAGEFLNKIYFILGLWDIGDDTPNDAKKLREAILEFDAQMQSLRQIGQREKENQTLSQADQHFREDYTHQLGQVCSNSGFLQSMASDKAQEAGSAWMHKDYGQALGKLVDCIDKVLELVGVVEQQVNKAKFDATREKQIAASYNGGSGDKQFRYGLRAELNT